MNKKYTIFCDIDGTLVYHHGDLESMAKEQPILLDGVKEKLDEWHNNGNYIVLTTARPYEMEQITKDMLDRFDLPYNRLIMGLPNYCRVLINDEKPYMIEPGNINPNTAIGIMVKRDKGIKDLKIE